MFSLCVGQKFNLLLINRDHIIYFRIRSVSSTYMLFLLVYYLVLYAFIFYLDHHALCPTTCLKQDQTYHALWEIHAEVTRPHLKAAGSVYSRSVRCWNPPQNRVNSWGSNAKVVGRWVFSPSPWLISRYNVACSSRLHVEMKPRSLEPSVVAAVSAITADAWTADIWVT